MSRCVGCGAILQSLDESKPGYIPASADAESKAYCKRCFQIRHHNLDYSKDNLDLMKNPDAIKARHNEYNNLLQNIKNESCLVILMIDALDIYTGFIPNLKDIIGENPVWILANKADVYPKDMKLQKIKEKIEQVAIKNGLKCNNIFFTSCIKEKNVDLIMDRMFTAMNRSHAPISNIYVIGATSVGKSTFINLILKKYAKEVDVLTTSMEANTTSSLVKIDVGMNHRGKECYIIDTPGYLNLDSILSCAPLETLKVLIPKNFIRVKSYQLKGNQTMYLGGLVRLDFECDSMNVACFVSDRLYIHRTKTENAEKAYNNLLFKEMAPPFSQAELDCYGEVKNYEFNSNDALNIWLSGIGIIHIKGSGKIKVSAPVMVKVTEDQDDLS